MFRRISVLLLILGLLAGALSISPVQITQAQAGPTPTRTATLAAGGSLSNTPTSGTAPLTVQFTPATYGSITSCSWDYGDGVFETVAAVSSKCPLASHTYTVGGTFSPRLYIYFQGLGSPISLRGSTIQVDGPTVTPTPTEPSTLPDLTILSISEYSYSSATTPVPNAQGCWWIPWVGTIYGVRVNLQNIGAADAGAFIVDLNSTQKTITGLAAGQTLSVDFPMTSRTRIATVDVTDLLRESDETNNSFTLALPAATATGTRTPRPTQCFTHTPTQTVGTPTRTPSKTVSPTISRTPTRTPTALVSKTPTVSPTPPTGTACSPVTSTITAPFSYDGVGTFCWQANTLGNYINSWNTTSVTINGTNYTNLWAATSSLPAKIGGYWYIHYNGPYPWSHFEAK